MQINQLNDDFAPARIAFCHTTEFINDSDYRGLDLSDEDNEPDMKNLYARDPDSQLNIYVLDLPSGLLGMGTFPWDPDAVGSMGGILIDKLHGVWAGRLLDRV